MPYVPVRIPALPGNPQFSGLIDSGASATRVHFEFAEQLGITDIEQAPTEKFQVAGGEYTCYEGRLSLRIGPMKAREIDVWFTKGWAFPHFLLGIRGFFDAYNVTIQGSRQMLSVKGGGARPVRAL